MSKLQPLTALKHFFLNPVIDKEYRLRMRTSRSMLILLVYLITVGLFSAVIFSMFGMNMNDPYSNRDAGIRFIVISFMQLGLIAFMSPALTAGVISTEREKQTLNLLLTTQQSSFNIIISKLFSSIGYMMLVVFATLPIYGIVFLYGGITPGQLLSVFAFYIFNMLVFGSFGVLFSTLYKRTIIAVIVSYVAIFFMFLATLGFYLIVYFMFEYYYYSPSTGYTNQQLPEFILHLLAINPGFAMYSVFDKVDWMDAMGMNHSTSSTSKSYFDYVPFWLEYVVFYSIVFVFNIWLAIRKLRPLKKKVKIKAVKEGV